MPVELFAIALRIVGSLIILAVGIFGAKIITRCIPKSSSWLSQRLGKTIYFSLVLAFSAIAFSRLGYSIPNLHSLLDSPQITLAQNFRPNILLGRANVAIGGGGYVTGVYPHPQQKDLVYIKTDVGGFYRWNPRNETWIPLTDHFNLDEKHYYGGEAIALDPNNPNLVYIAAGDHLWREEPGSLFKSSDRGETWTKLDLDLPMGGNDNKRWAGERLAVSPTNAQIILFGSRRDGLWKSQNAGQSWRQIKDFPGKPERNIGILCIVFDPVQAGVVYANAYGDGVYQSTDFGENWRKLENSPKTVNQMGVASDRTLYITSTRSPKVSKYANGTWEDITPKTDDAPFNGLSVNPNRPQNILASIGERPYNRTFQTTDGGKTWKEIKRNLNNTVSWWDGIMLKHPWVAGLAFDPQVPGRVWLTDWYGTWRTDNINAATVNWTNYVQGHEEVVVFSMISPPQGPLLVSGVADVDGFVHDRGLEQFPSHKFGKSGPEFQGTYGLAYAYNQPSNLVRVGGNQWNNEYSGATSRDGGKSWQKFATFPPETMPLRVAMSATHPNLFVVTTSGKQPIRTADSGRTWTTVKGLPDGPGGPWNWLQSLAADGADGQTFYYYYNNTVFRSTDGGATFASASEINGRNMWHVLKTIPGEKGEVWLGLDDRGLHRSTNGGESFRKIETVERAHLVSFGKPKPGSNTPALYIYGRVTGQGDGIFRSLDKGQTWTRIGDRDRPIGRIPNTLEASWQEYGLVFIGTNGRGIYYGSMR
ncbi:WD40/YVTN/BNR-like repeat-containing protein [Geitlerinema calcuttense]|uniref:Sortilin N-terminal domain-containing protein n=1 Tax=Geitlerinema calcuttense NRMC-F 0142 TaxID=2922238 RepID=A0ABT7M094_9CYAN|nr:hypothetical protein [Geitlerinema calcuttense]MDL5057685.1 hypothetical protein [Geitlerinema calcuttense NRMC-F 0142]